MKATDLYMRATGQSKYAADGQYTGSANAIMGKEGVACHTQGKWACMNASAIAKAKAAELETQCDAIF